MSLILTAVSCSARAGLGPLVSLDLRLEPGTVVGVTGPGGSGKSRLLDVLAGIETIDAGEISCLGDSDPRIVYQPVHPLLPPGWTVGRFLDTVGVPYGADDDPGRALGLGGYLEWVLDDLSARHRRALWVVAALGRSGDVYLFDEPTLGLDRTLVDEFVRRLRLTATERNATVAVVSVDLAFLERVSDRVVLLDGGRKVADGPVGELVEGQESLRLDQVWQHYFPE